MQAVRHGDDGRDDGFAFAGQVVHEAAVDLQLVDRQALQVRHRGIAGAEIVDRQVDARVLQAPHQFHVGVDIVHQDAFRDFQLQQAMRQLRLVQDGADIVHQSRVARLAGRQVDGHVFERIEQAGLAPAGCLAAGALQHPASQLDDDAAFLGHGDEFTGAELPHLAAVPAYQRFHADDAPAAQVDLRLVVQIQFLVLQGTAQVRLHAQAALGAQFHFGLEHGIAVLALVLGVVHGRVGIARQGGHVLRIEWIQAHADAGADIQLVAFQRERRGQHGKDLARHAGHFRSVVGRFDDDDEFVAADAADDVGGAQDRHQALGDEFEQLVAAVVAQRIVDHLEVVQVQQQQSHAAVLAVGARQRVGQGAVEFMAVRQLRDRVDVGQVVQMAFRMLGGAARAAHHQDRQAERTQADQQGEGGKLRQAAEQRRQAGAQIQCAAAGQVLQQGGAAVEVIDLQAAARRCGHGIAGAARVAGEWRAVRTVEQCLPDMRRGGEGSEHLLRRKAIIVAHGLGSGWRQHVGLDAQVALERCLEGKQLEEDQQQAGRGQHGRCGQQVQSGYPVTAQLHRGQHQWHHHDAFSCRSRLPPPHVIPPRPAILVVPV